MKEMSELPQDSAINMKQVICYSEGSRTRSTGGSGSNVKSDARLLKSKADDAAVVGRVEKSWMERRSESGVGS